VQQDFCLCGEKQGHRGMSFATHHMNGNTVLPFPPSSVDLNNINPTATEKTRGPSLLPQHWEQGSSGDSRTRCGNRKKVLCLGTRLWWLLEDCCWDALTVLGSRTVPGGLVTLCALELVQVLLPSSDGCVLTVCKTNRSPSE